MKTIKMTMTKTWRQRVAVVCRQVYGGSWQLRAGDVDALHRLSTVVKVPVSVSVFGFVRIISSFLLNTMLRYVNLTASMMLITLPDSPAHPSWICQPNWQRGQKAKEPPQSIQVPRALQMCGNSQMFFIWFQWLIAISNGVDLLWFNPGKMGWIGDVYPQ